MHTRPLWVRQPLTSHTQKRNAFSLASMFGKKRDPAGANIDPGLDKLMELEKMQRLKARLPPPEDVAQAMHSFTQSRLDSRPRRGIEDNQARLLLHGLRYCSQQQAERTALHDANRPLSLPDKVLRSVIQCLRRTKNITASHIELGEALYVAAGAQTNLRPSLLRDALLAYVRALALAGRPQEALDAATAHESAFAAKASIAEALPDSDLSRRSPVLDEEDADPVATREPPDETSDASTFQRALPLVLRGFALHGPAEKVDTILSMIRQEGVSLGSGGSRIMLEYSLRQNDYSSALHWWREGRRIPSTKKDQWKEGEEQVYAARQILDWCLANNASDSGHQIVQEMAESGPTKPEWDAILVWAAGIKTSVDEIDRMIGVMVQSNESIKDRAQWRLPDIATINALVEAAVSRGDPYTAERFIALGRDKGIEPDAKTFVLQMDYRLRVDDVDGALTAYKNVQGLDLSSNEDIPTVNRLIVALCKTGRHDFETIMNVAADLSDRRARFEPDTVATLSLLHLRRDERYDVIDLLNTHAYHFSSTERENIRNALLAFALEGSTSTALAWDTYTILRELFDEMPRTQRTELMTSFIRRERADMGVHVFQNMRMHSRADTMPIVDTYVTAFMALAKIRDLDNLEIVHNQLKLDFNIQPSTYLLNALIIAYTACGKPRLALDYWDEISISREGPSYNSVHVALRACEKAPFGDLKAQEIGSILRKRGVELDQSLWASYVAALAGNGNNEMALHALEEGVEKGEVVIDEFILGSLMAAGANKEKQDDMERWARERAESVWHRLVEKGFETDVVGMRHFNVDRSVAP